MASSLILTISSILFDKSLGIYSYSSPYLSQKESLNTNTMTVDGYVTHGINNFNGNKIVDLSEESPFNDIPYYEIGAENIDDPDGDEELPTIFTNRDRRLVITSSFFEDWAPIISDILPGIEGQTTMDLNLKNKPILDVGVLFFGAQNIDDRIIPTTFEDGIFTNQKSYLPFGSIINPTLNDWEQASGQINLKCEYSHELKKIITKGVLKICNALPLSIYTVWEIGVVNAQLQSETPNVQPAGGVGNVFRTDKYGNAEYEWYAPFCSLNPCLQGGSCTVYYSAFMHFDYSVWGQTFGGTTMKPIGYPAGVAGSNHLWFPIRGKKLQEPSTNIDQCRNNNNNNNNDIFDYINRQSQPRINLYQPRYEYNRPEKKNNYYN